MFRTGAAMLYLKEAVYMRFKDLDSKYGTGALRIGNHRGGPSVWNNLNDSLHVAQEVNTWVHISVTGATLASMTRQLIEQIIGVGDWLKAFFFVYFPKTGNELVVSSPNGFVLPDKHLHFRKEMNQILDRLVSMGFAQGLQRKYYPIEALLQTRAGRESPPAITFSHIVGSLLVLLIGFVGSTIVFIMEKLHEFNSSPMKPSLK